MAQARSAVANKVAWVDLSSSDAAKARDFYSKLFGWKLEISPDPQYGGYALAKVGGKDAAGIGPKQDPKAPSAWTVYIGTDDAKAVAKSVQAAGGKVIMQPFSVGDQGTMAVFQDPTGAFISVWQPSALRGFETGAPGTYGWAELNARGIDKAIAFYTKVFGWTAKKSSVATPDQPYTEFQIDGDSIAGAMEMNPMAPASMPSYWGVYFNVDDVDASFKKALQLGAREMLGPQDFPGGRFAIASDPEGAVFGLLKMRQP